MNRHLRNLGYFLIWGDFYLLIFSVHAFFIAPITLGEYLTDYLQAGLVLSSWLGSISEMLNDIIQFWMQYPAWLLFFSRFAVSTTVGVWLVRRFSSSENGIL